MTLKKPLQLLTLFLFFTNFHFTAQNLTERIDNVENSLSPLVSIEGESLWNLQERMRQYKTPGLSITVIKDYKIDWTKSYGQISNDYKNEVTNETVFQAGSISKFVNALAIMKLCEQNNIELDSDINSHLTSWKFPYKNSSDKITLRQILSHTGGLSMSGFSGYKKAENLPTTIEILEGNGPANSEKVISIIPANQEFKYSGGGTTISQLILTDNANVTYENFISNYIFTPLKIENSFYSIQEEKYTKNISSGHTRKGKPLKNNYNFYPESAAAGLWTTTSDLANILIDFQLSLNDNEGKILSKESAVEMIKPVLNNSNSGLGVFLEKQGENIYLQHSAATRGFRGKFFISAKGGNGVVILTNGTSIKILEEIIRSVAITYNWDGFKIFERNLDITYEKSDLIQYVGTYGLNKRKIQVKLKKGKLILSEKGKWSSKLTPIDDSKFVIDIVKPRATIQFKNDENGAVSRCILNQGGLTEWKKEI